MLSTLFFIVFFSWEAAKERLKAEEQEINEMLKERDQAYEQLVSAAENAYAPPITELERAGKQQSFFGKFFG